jgi:hypothetical protein
VGNFIVWYIWNSHPSPRKRTLCTTLPLTGFLYMLLHVMSFSVQMVVEVSITGTCYMLLQMEFVFSKMLCGLHLLTQSAYQ